MRMYVDLANRYVKTSCRATRAKQRPLLSAETENDTHDDTDTDDPTHTITHTIQMTTGGSCLDANVQKAIVVFIHVMSQQIAQGKTFQPRLLSWYMSDRKAYRGCLGTMMATTGATSSSHHASKCAMIVDNIEWLVQDVVLTFKSLTAYINKSLQCEVLIPQTIEAQRGVDEDDDELEEMRKGKRFAAQCPTTALFPSATKRHQLRLASTAWRVPRFDQAFESTRTHASVTVHEHLFNYVLMTSYRLLSHKSRECAHFLYWHTFQQYLQYRVWNTITACRELQRTSNTLKRLVFVYVYTVLFVPAMRKYANAYAAGKGIFHTYPSTKHIVSNMREQLLHKSFDELCATLFSESTRMTRLQLLRNNEQLANPVLPTVLIRTMNDCYLTMAQLMEFLGVSTILQAAAAGSPTDPDYQEASAFVTRLVTPAVMRQTSSTSDAPFDERFCALSPLLPMQKPAIVRFLQSTYALNPDATLFSETLLDVITSQCDAEGSTDPPPGSALPEDGRWIDVYHAPYPSSLCRDMGYATRRTGDVGAHSSMLARQWKSAWKTARRTAASNGV